MSGIRNFHFDEKISFLNRWERGYGDRWKKGNKWNEEDKWKKKKSPLYLGVLYHSAKKESGGDIIFFGIYIPLQVYCSYGRLTIVLRRGVYYLHNWYFCPPPFFQNDIFPPSTVKLSPFSPFFHHLPFKFTFFSLGIIIFLPQPTNISYFCTPDYIIIIFSRFISELKMGTLAKEVWETFKDFENLVRCKVM